MNTSIIARDFSEEFHSGNPLRKRLRMRHAWTVVTSQWWRQALIVLQIEWKVFRHSLRRPRRDLKKLYRAS